MESTERFDASKFTSTFYSYQKAVEIVQVKVAMSAQKGCDYSVNYLRKRNYLFWVFTGGHSTYIPHECVKFDQMFDANL